MIVLFVASMAAANLLVAWLGPWFSPVNAFFLVGLSMVARDRLHDRWRELGTWHFYGRMMGVISVAGFAAWVVNPAAGRIAVASATALVASALAETLVFDRLADRPWLVRSNGSNLPGSLVDTVVFTSVAFGISSTTLAVMVVQAGTKLAGGALFSLLLNPRVGHRPVQPAEG